MKTNLSTITSTHHSRALRLAIVALVALVFSAYHAAAHTIGLPTPPTNVSLLATGHSLIIHQYPVTVRSNGASGATLVTGTITIVLVKADGITIAGVGTRHLVAKGTGQVDQQVTVPVILDQNAAAAPNCTVKYVVFGRFSDGTCANEASSGPFPNILSLESEEISEGKPEKK